MRLRSVQRTTPKLSPETASAALDIAGQRVQGAGVLLFAMLMMQVTEQTRFSR